MDATLTLIIVFVLLQAIVVAVLYVLLKKIFTAKKTDDNGGMLMLQNQINELARTLDTKMGQSQETMRHQLEHSVTIVRDVTEKLTRLDETNRQVVSFADQLKNLQDILKNPKQRGILGEYYLETLLKNVLPPGSYQMQYPLGKDEKTGKDLIVDAVVFVKDKIIPIDSKFSLENYNRLAEERNEAERDRLEKLFVNDLKLRIQETAKYIKPEARTMEFAFMFIPHEAIYYDLLVNKIGALREEDTENLIQRAANKYHVIIVSPTSFLAYLQTVLHGLREQQIAETATDVIKRVGELGKHLSSYNAYLAKVGANLATTVNAYNAAHHEFEKIDKDVLRVTGEKIGIEPVRLEKPQQEE
jgi:DNA recombination protein RmuC